ncbi:MAG TPA: NUDIX hydrolase [Clostridia bacterium]|nr:NUDIX hydrolase [Clostridia bacterium]
MKLEEKTIEARYIYKGSIINLRKDRVELPTGREASREVVEHNGGVGVAAVDEDGNVYLVNQFRYPYQAEMLEIPAGKLVKGEEPLACGKRELKEETGICAKEYASLGQLYPSPGYTDEIIYLYFARGLEYGEQQPDEDEFLDVVKIPLEKAVDLVLSGEIKDSKTQTALLKVWMILSGCAPSEKA